MSKQSDSPPLLWQPDDPQVLHDFLMLALEERVLKRWEAAQILAECQESEQTQVQLSEKLRAAAQRLQLWTLETSPTLH